MKILSDDKKFNSIYQALTLIKSKKTSMKNLNFKNEKNLMQFFYTKIENRPSKIKNFRFYNLERSMQFETKKLILTTLNESKEIHNCTLDNHNRLKILYRITEIKDIKLYEPLCKIYIEFLKTNKVKDFLDILGIVYVFIDRLLTILEFLENNNEITNSDILEELEFFPMIYLHNKTSFVNQFKIKSDFSKKDYDDYNEFHKSLKTSIYRANIEYCKPTIVSEFLKFLFLNHPN
ncbi:hypothetical protein [Miniphocaeibacter halophilus]|uniref:Uncharacterized protein n=1 Tax=Miniphocaeibacter halophilus TaxID=2931922 RepID=A0AC61MTP5_9FIRM|nr:hypothetical protein [Miniphocaeibacter halophilus]QQK09022.1 hypothetical protein JFY71_05655 [Miniphocaeibacter halophilus]